MGGKKILLVEGPDDEHVFKQVCQRRGMGQIAEILAQNGVDRLLEVVPVRLKESGIEALGVVLDADTDLAARWKALQDRLGRAGYNAVPRDPETRGTVIQPPPNTLLPRFGVWIMPDNRSPGILEDFLRLLAPAASPLFQHAERSVANIPEGERRFKPQDKPKAVIHTWLAWQAEPGRPYGTATTARYLDPNVPQADVLVDWMRHLFV